MFNGNWRNGFTIGIVVGFCLTPILLFAAIVFFQLPNDFPHGNGETRNSVQGQPQDSRWWLISRVVYMEDTAAQWIIMFATIVAAIFLLRTLWITQHMAAEGTRIGEAQVRAYLTIEDCYITPDPRRDYIAWDIRFTVRNCGQSPARRLKCQVRIGNERQLEWIILPDIAASAEYQHLTRLTTDLKDLFFSGPDKTKVIVTLVVHVSFEDVFSTTHNRNKEGADFVGRFDLVGGDEVKLSPTGRSIADVFDGIVAKRQIGNN